jgi:pimeloyl-ACP methyl ester carboxylesterase
MDAQGISRAHLVGNSLGGRVAIEVGLRRPERVQSLSLLCPSMAWRRRRHFVPLVRLLRPELAAIPHTFGDALVRQQFWSMFSRPERIHPSAADVAVEEFLRNYRSVNARVAFHAAARHIYLEEPKGPKGFYTRLSELDPPAMFVWGDEDPLVPLAFSRYVSDALPDARQVVLDQCGHVPQVEHPVDANALVHDFIGHAQASTAERAAKRLSRAARRLQGRINGSGGANGADRKGEDSELTADAA